METQIVAWYLPIRIDRVFVLSLTTTECTDQTRIQMSLAKRHSCKNVVDCKLYGCDSWTSRG